MNGPNMNQQAVCRQIAREVKDAIVFGNLHGLIDAEGYIVPVPAGLQYGWSFDSEPIIAAAIEAAVRPLFETIPNSSPAHAPPPEHA